MKLSFKSWLTEEARYTAHMTHLSDMLFISGVAGAKKAVDYLRDLRNMFSHSSSNKYSVKFDGAPAIVCGVDPADGKFFVAKKGIFNKNPKVYKTQADVDADLTGELNDKFKILLQTLPSLGIKSGIYQGDLMYTSSDLKTETVDGESMIVFHPNTIAYAVPVDSGLGKRIAASKVGIVFHTTYTGNTFNELKPIFGKDIVNKFNKSNTVWAVDAALDNKTAEFTLSNGEYISTEFLLKEIGQQFQKIDSGMLNHIYQDETLSSVVLIYINSLVRNAVKSLSGKQMSEDFYKFIGDRFQKSIDQRKTNGAKTAIDIKRKEALAFFDKYSHDKIAAIFELSTSIEALKDMLLTKMQKVAGLKHFLKTKDGFVVTNPEGFVAINSETGEAVKLVDRMVFSRANFGSDVIKGWVK